MPAFILSHTRRDSYREAGDLVAGGESENRRHGIDKAGPQGEQSRMLPPEVPPHKNRDRALGGEEDAARKRDEGKKVINSVQKKPDGQPYDNYVRGKRPQGKIIFKNLLHIQPDHDVG